MELWQRLGHQRPTLCSALPCILPSWSWRALERLWRCIALYMTTSAPRMPCSFRWLELPAPSRGSGPPHHLSPPQESGSSSPSARWPPWIGGWTRAYCHSFLWEVQLSSPCGVFLLPSHGFLSFFHIPFGKAFNSFLFFSYPSFENLGTLCFPLSSGREGEGESE